MMSFKEKKYDIFQMFNDRWALATAGSIEEYKDQVPPEVAD